MIDTYHVASEEDLQRVWAVLGDDIRRGFKRGHGDTYTEQGFIESLLNHDREMLAFVEEQEIVSCMAVGFHSRPKGRIMTVDMIAGKLNDEIIDAGHAALRHMADKVGAKKIETVARQGIVDKWKKQGWKTKATIMTLET